MRMRNGEAVMPKNYYFILGIPATSSQKEIKSAFRRLAKEYHPDHYGEGHSPFQNIQEAYAILGDPERRRAYDKQNRTQQIRRRSVPGNSNVEPTRRHRGVKVEPLNPAEDPDNFEAAAPSRDLHASRPSVNTVFDFLMQSFIRPGQPAGEQFQSHTAVVALTPTEARRGGNVRVQVPASFQCPNCQGEGYPGFHECWRCRGTGSLIGTYPVLIRYPPGIRDNDMLRLSLERFGLKNRYLNLNFRISSEKL